MIEDGEWTEEAYVRLVHFLADSVFDASDEEIAEEMLAAGEDVEENAERLRAKMLDAAQRGLEIRLRRERGR